MKAFLQELAEEIYNSHADLSKVTVVFPNRRAVLYFRKYLGELISKPVSSYIVECWALSTNGLKVGIF